MNLALQGQLMEYLPLARMVQASLCSKAYEVLTDTSSYSDTQIEMAVRVIKNGIDSAWKLMPVVVTSSSLTDLLVVTEDLGLITSVVIAGADQTEIDTNTASFQQGLVQVWLNLTSVL